MAPTSTPPARIEFRVRFRDRQAVLVAPGQEAARAFATVLREELQRGAARWTALSDALIAQRIDWPAWQKYRRLLHDVAALRRGDQLPREQWRVQPATSDDMRAMYGFETSADRQARLQRKAVLYADLEDLRTDGDAQRWIGLLEAELVDFGEFHALTARVPADLKARYVAFAWNAARLRPPGGDEYLSEADAVLLRGHGLAVRAAKAPLEVLVHGAPHQVFDDLRAALPDLRILGGLAGTARFVLDHAENPRVMRALRGHPHWQGMSCLQPPPGWSWQRFQDFRLLRESMARLLVAFLEARTGEHTSAKALELLRG